MTVQPATVSTDHAKRWAERARLDLEASADRGESGMSKIRTAIAERHDIALKYRSIGDYVSTEYADALGNVCRVFGVEFRRQVVAELSDTADMSTRDIAAVTGTSHTQARRDRDSGGTPVPPDDSGDWSPVQHGAGFVAPGEEIPHDQTSWINRETGEVCDDYPSDDATGGEVTSSAEAQATTGSAWSVADDAGEAPGEEVEPVSPSAPSRLVVGRDGKTYTRTEPSKRRRKHAERPGSTKWSRRVQAVSASVPMESLTHEELLELRGAAEFLHNYVKGELVTRERKAS